MLAFIAGYCGISLIESVAERRNYFEQGTDRYYNRNEHLYVDEDMRLRLEAKLLYSIVTGFKVLPV